MAVLSGKSVVEFEERKITQLNQKGFGKFKDGKLYISIEEALYLLEKNKLEIEDKKGKTVSEKKLLKEADEKNFLNKFIVYKDLRDRGYVVKTGFKFGFDFRVYPRGKKPGEEHTQWVIKVKGQEASCQWSDFSRMVRLAGNLRTAFLHAVVDKEKDINYYEIKRISP